MGMVHKLHAYCDAVGWTLADASLLLQVAAVVLGTIEFVLGVYLLLGIRRKLATRSALVLTSLFTLLTVWVYLANPVSDCGCFGEAITLTNGQTLGKNVVLLVLCIFLGYYHRLMRPVVSERNAWIVSIYSLIYAPALAIYTLHYLPVLEFTPYKIGADIRAAVSGETMSEDAPTSAPDPLSNFYVLSAKDEEDYTFTLLADTGYTFLLTLPNVAEADDGSNDRINDLYDFVRDHRCAFYLVTAEDSAGVASWLDRTGAAYPVLLAGQKSDLQTMVRSNPGLLLLHNGKIASKWSNNDLPELSEQNSIQDLEALIPSADARPLLWLLLWFVIPLLLVIVADRLWIGHKFLKHHFYINHFIKHKHTMRKKIVAGNWKMNKTLQEGVALAKELNEVLTADKPQCDVIICTPFIHLASVAGTIDPAVIGLGAENCADKESGAYTGEVSAAMVKSTGAQYVILGHSERRAYYHETPEILKEKVNLALANDLKVIFCIGEVLEEREAGKQNEVVKAQLEGSLFDLTPAQLSNVILAYEPVWAIGTGKTATSDQAEEMHAFIRKTIADKFGAEAAENISILYGGSCKPGNAPELFAKPDVDGGLIGGAALKAADFKGIIDAWKK